MLDQLTDARDKAQNELAQAEIALLQSTAAAEVLREEVHRLNSAVAALSGEKAPADPSGRTHVTKGDVRDEVIPEDAPHGDIHEMTPEEFDAERKRKQRARQKEIDAENLANNPYATVPCGGCGTKGSLQDSFITAPSGAQVRMLVCTKCNNQIMT